MDKKRHIYIGSNIFKNMKEEILNSLGLSNKEIKIYLANLQLGSNLVQNIANFAELNRTSAYDLLKSLEQKGFVSYTIQSGKRFYQATNPNKLIGMLKEKEQLVKKILPELNSLSESVGKRPNVEVYTGKNGIKTIFEEILSEAKEFSIIGSKEDSLKLFKYYFPYFVKRRKKRKMKVRIISEAPPLDKEVPYKIIKKKIKTQMWLYNKKIAMVSLEEKEPIGVVIEEKNFYETQKMMFDMLWESL